MSMSELSLRLADGTKLLVPPSLESITTYVVLEQEAWFEKEAAFLAHWLRPGMTVIDIGANLGIYSLPSARQVAPGGNVFAYEPASEPRAMLSRSGVLNGTTNLHVIAAAVSDSNRKGRLTLGTSSELNALDAGGHGEDVQVTSLDIEDGARGWGAVDFVKIDAEGQEVRILEGGRRFFERHSPLVMFEIKTDVGNHEHLRRAFPLPGYRLYRSLPGAPLLVPDDPTKPLDGFEFNMFAAKSDRSAELARLGLLVETVPTWAPDGTARSNLRGQALPFLSSASFDGVDPSYLNGLAGYATWRSPELPAPQRYAALEAACAILFNLCRRAATPPRLSTLARALGDAGHRIASVDALMQLTARLSQGARCVGEPFWPANPRFEATTPGQDWAERFEASCLEQAERSVSYSSCFGGKSGVDLDQLSRRPGVSVEIDRRRTLRSARAGRRTDVPPRLCVASADHVNADVWRAGLVPNTMSPHAMTADP